MNPDVLSMTVESTRAALRIRAPEGTTLDDTVALARVYARKNGWLAPLVWVWCWGHEMNECGPAAAFAMCHRGTVLSHRMHPALIASYYVPIMREV